MLHKVCRAYHKAPDEVRAWEYDDFLDALETLGEVPLVDEAFYAAFAGKAGGDDPGPDLRTPTGRKAFLEDLDNRRAGKHG